MELDDVKSEVFDKYSVHQQINFDAGHDKFDGYDDKFVKNAGAVAEDELQNFCDAVLKSVDSRCVYTVDYFNSSFGILQGKESPSSLNFSVALLQEILCYISPSHELWDKIKYATFLLHLATRDIEFCVLYDIYHQVEKNIASKHTSWTDVQTQSMFEEKIIEKLIVKEDLTNIADLHDSDIKNPDLNNFSFDNDVDDKMEDDEDYAPDNDYIPDDENYKQFLFQEIDNHLDEDTKPRVKRKYTKRKNLPNGTKVPKKRVKKKLEVSDTEEVAEEDDGKIKYGGWSRTVATIPVYSKITGKRLKKKVRPGILPCPSCDYSAKDNYDYDKHMFHEHEACRLCSQCGHLSTSLKEYTAHNQTHIYTCDICQEKKLGIRGLRKHMKKHETVTDREVIKTDKTRVPCDKCGVLLFENNLKQHMMNEHTFEVHKCDLCSYTANAKIKLTTHRKTHFKPTSKCNECGKVVKDMKKHFIRNCDGRKKERHFCHLCDKSFSLKDSMERHIKHIHQKILKFHCQHCDYKTYAGYNLKLHVSKMHTKEEIEKICPYCHQKTGSLDYHIRIYHIEEHQLKNAVHKQEDVVNTPIMEEKQLINQG